MEGGAEENDVAGGQVAPPCSWNAHDETVLVRHAQWRSPLTTRYIIFSAASFHSFAALSPLAGSGTITASRRRCRNLNFQLCDRILSVGLLICPDGRRRNINRKLLILASH